MAALLVLLALGLLSGAPAAAEARDPPTPRRVLIADIVSPVLAASELEYLAASLSDRFAALPGLSVVDAAARAAALAELEAAFSGGAADSGRLRLGVLVAATHLVTGSIGRAGARGYLMNLQLLAVDTAEIEKSTGRSYPSLALLLADLDNVVASLLLEAREVPAEYVVLTAASQRSFWFFPARAAFLRDGGDGLALAAVGAGFQAEIGRPWGLVVEASLCRALWIERGGASLSPSELQFPYLIQTGLGARWLGALGGPFLLEAAGGLQFAEFLSMPRSGSTATIQGNAVFLDVGPWAELSLLWRWKLASYLKASLAASWFPHTIRLIGGLSGSGSGLALTPSIAFGLGRN